MKKSIVAVSLAFTATLAQADFKLQTIETLIHAQAMDTFLLWSTEQPSATTTLLADFTVDTGSGSFSYQSRAGQLYNGRSYTLNGQGGYDANTQTYTWAATTLLGTGNFSQTGQSTLPGSLLASDPPEGPVDRFVKGPFFRDGRLVGDFYAFVKVFPPVVPGSSSASTGVATVFENGEAPKSIRVIDEVTPGPVNFVTFHIAASNNDLNVFDMGWTGVTNGDVITGTSIVTISAIPEPRTWMLTLAGTLVCFVWQRRLRGSRL